MVFSIVHNNWNDYRDNNFLIQSYCSSFEMLCNELNIAKNGTSSLLSN